MRAKLPFRALVACVLAAGTLATARADLLYWWVDFSDNLDEMPWTDTSTTPQVWLVASADPASSVGGTRLTDGLSVTDGQTERASIVDLSGFDSASWSFFVEMGATLGMADYVSGGYNYDQLKDLGYIKEEGIGTFEIWNAALATPWTSTHDVPEPTSGVLMALGAALLALRRRRGCTVVDAASRRVVLKRYAVACG